MNKSEILALTQQRTGVESVILCGTNSYKICITNMAFSFELPPPLSGQGERVRRGGLVPVPEVRARLRVVRRLLALHRQPQLGPQDHPPRPPVHHHRQPLHRRPLHHQVQRNQGMVCRDSLYLFRPKVWSECHVATLLIALSLRYHGTI